MLRKPQKKDQRSPLKLLIKKILDFLGQKLGDYFGFTSEAAVQITRFFSGVSGGSFWRGDMEC